MPEAVTEVNRNIGSSLDELLAEDKVLEDVSARAMKRVLVWQLRQGMKQRGLTKVAMAKRMRTSRSGAGPPARRDRYRPDDRHLGAGRACFGLQGQAGAGARVMPPPAHILQFRIELLGIEPLIWRRVQVPDTYSFWDLHVAIQSTFGCNDTHLHEYELLDHKGQVEHRLGIPFDDDDNDSTRPKLPPGWQHRVTNFLAPKHATVLYCYDFGDNWRHEVTLEDVLSPSPGKRYPRCVAGECAGPPDNCGGTGGYSDLLEVLADPSHEEHASAHRWAASTEGVRGKFDPEAFDEQLVKFDNSTRRLKRMLGNGQ